MRTGGRLRAGAIAAGTMALIAAAVVAAAAAQDRVAAGLPDPEAFLRDVRERLARSQAITHRFAYMERRVDLHMNPFGRMGMGDTRVRQVFPSPVPQLTYRREIERNGVPVPAEQLARQDAEYRAKVEQVRRRLAREDEDDRDARERDELLARRRAQRMVDDVVATLRFEVARREIRNGVPSIVIEFQGRPEARPFTREGRIARVFKGSIWVHEAAREVMDVEAVATDDVSFGGFIAKLYEGTQATLERREVQPGVWMPTRIRFEGQARALFRRATIDLLVEWFEYRPMTEAQRTDLLKIGG